MITRPADDNLLCVKMRQAPRDPANAAGRLTATTMPITSDNAGSARPLDVRAVWQDVD
jgi:hypothetical protein